MMHVTCTEQKLLQQTQLTRNKQSLRMKISLLELKSRPHCAETVSCREADAMSLTSAVKNPFNSRFISYRSKIIS
jgi:hypothetical protein